MRPLMSWICAKLALPMIALGHDAAGDAHAAVRACERVGGPRFGVGVFALQIAGECVGLEVVRERDALRAQRAQFLAALGDELVFVWAACGSLRSSLIPSSSFRACGPAIRFVDRVHSTGRRFRGDDDHARIARFAPASSPAFRLASTNSSRSPSSTFCVSRALDAGAQILDARLVEHVVADLAAPADVGLRRFERVLLGIALLHLELVQLRLQHLHRAVAVRVLERSVWQATTMPVGTCVMRTADSVLLTCWPPAPDER